MRKLYLIRHGTPDFKDGIKLCIGRTEIDIGEQGILDAEKLRDFFANKKIDGIYSSPLIRCMHTAEIIANGKKDVIVHYDLAEIYMGHWEGKALKDINKKLGDEPSDGEKRIDALARMEKAIRNIMRNTSGDIICVAHAGVNCAFVAKNSNQDIRTSRAIKQPCGCYNEFNFDGESFQVVSIGCIPEC